MNSGDDGAKLDAVGAMRPDHIVAAAELVLNDLIGPIRVRANSGDPLEADCLAVFAGQFVGTGVKRRGSVVIAGPPSPVLNAFAADI